MTDLAAILRQANYTNRVFDERQLASVLGPGAPRRYGLVNRALKDGTLVRIKRGLYALGSQHRSDSIHLFAVAQALLPTSYISFESALAYHGWIPEAVYTTVSVTPERKTLHYDGKPFGQFTFHPLAIQPYQFLIGVERKTLGTLTALVATPLRALMDLVALRKIEWSGLDWVTQGMRIQEDQLLALSEEDFVDLAPVYKHLAVRTFLLNFDQDVQALKAARSDISPND